MKRHIIICWSMLLLILSSELTSAQFSIGPGGFITVKPGGSMMIGTDLHIKSIAGSSGALADQNAGGNITITGDITVDRYMSPDIWHNVASPVSNETSGCYTGTDLVFWYNESLIWNDWNFGWVWYNGPTGGPLMVFRGYDVMFETNPVTVNYEATGAETINTGSYTYNVTLSDPAPNPFEIPSHKGWNLAGNPYPSPVDWLAAGWGKTNINDAKYIWDGANDIYTIFIGGSAPYGLNGGTRFIPSNQGFWVQAVQNGSISINNSTRLGDISGTPDFYKMKPVDYPLLSLVASGNGKNDEVVIRFIEGTTDGFDVNYDASKLLSFIEIVPQLSIKAGKMALALSTLPLIREELCIPVNFQCGKPGYYQIRLSEKSKLDPNVQVYLKDELDHKIVNLTTDSTYGFYHELSNNTGRFNIWFNPSEEIINDIPAQSFFSVYYKGNEIIILKNTTLDISGEIIVYNMIGQIVVRKMMGNDHKTSLSLNSPSGYYIVSIKTYQQSYNSKILISN